MTMNSDEFKQFMQESGITPRKKSDRIVTQKAKPKASVKQLPTENITHHEPLSDFIAEPLAAEDLVSFYRPGIQKSLVKQLKTGNIRPEDTIDLHGLTIEQARTALLAFLHDSQQQGLRCVCVIHGKGQRHSGAPILKNQVTVWLRQLEHVMAFCSPPKPLGGSGSVSIILRRLN